MCSVISWIILSSPCLTKSFPFAFCSQTLSKPGAFHALWWHSVEITRAAALYELNIRLGVINSASLEDPQSSVSKQETAITPGKDFPQAEIHESAGAILCCKFL